MRNAISRFLFGRRDWLKPRKAGSEYLLLLTILNGAVWLAQIWLFEVLSRGTHAADATGFVVIITAFVTILVYMVVNERLWIAREYAHASFLMGGMLTLGAMHLLGL